MTPCCQGNKPVSEPVLTQIYLTTLSWNVLISQKNIFKNVFQVAIWPCRISFRCSMAVVKVCELLKEQVLDTGVFMLAGSHLKWAARDMDIWNMRY